LPGKHPRSKKSEARNQKKMKPLGFFKNLGSGL